MQFLFSGHYNPSRLASDFESTRNAGMLAEIRFVAVKTPETIVELYGWGHYKYKLMALLESYANAKFVGVGTINTDFNAAWNSQVYVEKDTLLYRPGENADDILAEIREEFIKLLDAK